MDIHEMNHQLSQAPPKENTYYAHNKDAEIGLHTESFLSPHLKKKSKEVTWHKTSCFTQNTHPGNFWLHHLEIPDMF